MSIIYSYPEQGALNANDMLIGTSAEKVGGKQKNITRNFSVQQIADFINGGAGFIDPVASDFQIAVFNQAGKKITGSIMSQDAFPGGTGITISGNLTATGNITTPLNLTANGVVSLGGQANLISLNSVTKLGGPIQDATGTLGNVNQILLSNGSGVVTWQNYEAGLTYEGTWDADLNTTNGLANSPALVQGVGVSGHFYIVNVEGTTSLGPGLNDWHVGDWAIFLDEGSQPASWQKIDNTSTLVGSGTAGTLSKWTNATTLNDSLVSEAGTVVSVNGDLKVKDTVEATTTNSNLKLKGNGTGGVEIMSADGTTDGKITLNCSQNSHGVTLQSPPHASGATYTLILPTSFGGAGDVLTSAGANPSQLVWTTPTTGTVTGTGTENYVTKWSAGGTGIENSTIFDNGTNVGIGTTSPSTKLDVAAEDPVIRITNTKINLTSGDLIGGLEFFTEDSSTGASRVLSAITSSNTTTSANPSGNLIFKTSTGGGGAVAATEKMRITPEGNVGIGTASPASVLHVSGGSVTIPTLSTSHPFLISGPNNSGMSIISSTGNAGQVVFGDEIDADSGRLRYDHSDNSMRFWTNADERIRIDSSGNVGIGTSSPDMPLSTGVNQDRQAIFGQDRAAGESTIYIGSEAASDKSLGITFDNDNVKAKLYVGGDKSKNPLVITDGGNVGIGTDSTSRRLTVNSGIQQVTALIESTSSLSTQINIRNGNSNNGGFIKTTGDNVILTANNTGISHLVVADGGNVGIGTESPAVSLDISATDAVQMPVGVTGDRPTIATGVSNGMLRYNSSNNGFEGYINGNWGDIGGGTSGGLIFRGTFDASTGTIAGGGNLTTGATRVAIAVGDMYIVDTAGDFYGDTSRPLNVGDEVICVLDATVGTSDINDWNAIASGAGGAVTGSGTINYVPKFTGATVVGNSSIFNDAAGNVGIGTSSPNGKLEVDLGGDGIISQFVGASSDTLNITGQNNEILLDTRNTSNGLAFGIQGSTKMVLNASGNVGIGTTSPGTKLHVSSGDQSTSRIRLSNTNTGGNDIDLVAGINNVGQDGFSIYNVTSNQTQLVVQSGGNVGIGTTSPGAKLEVDGGVGVYTTGGTFVVRQKGDTSSDGISLTSSASLSHRMYKNASGTFLMGPSNNADAFSLSLDGKVGIGVTSPESILHVKKSAATILVQDTNTGFATTEAYIKFSGTDSSGNFRSDIAKSIGIKDNSLVFENVSSETMRITSVGQVKFNNYTAANSFTGTAVASLAVDSSGNIITEAAGGGGAGTITTNIFSGNGTVGPFTLGATPSGGSTSFVDVFIDGVYQEITNYTVSGTALSFVVGAEPPIGTSIQTKTTSGAVSGALVSSVDIGQSSGDTGAVNLRINPIEVPSGTTPTGVANSLYIFTATAGGSISTLTLPASPTLGDSIKISNLGGLANVLGANGNKIMGVAADLTINTPTAAFELIWSGSNNGWIIIGNV